MHNLDIREYIAKKNLTHRQIGAFLPNRSNRVNDAGKIGISPRAVKSRLSQRELTDDEKREFKRAVRNAEKEIKLKG